MFLDWTTARSGGAHSHNDSLFPTEIEIVLCPEGTEDVCCTGDQCLRWVFTQEDEM